jgi:hypothetical protein
MDISVCLLSGFVGGIVAWEVFTILSIVYFSPKRDRVPKRVPKSSTQFTPNKHPKWKGVHLDIIA